MAGKVDETLTAIIAPADATNVASYQWYTGATASLTDQISGATESTYKVTAAEAGKFIGVVVTDTEGNSFTAVSSVAVQAEQTEKVQIVSAEQKSGTVIELKLNKKVAPADYNFEVKRGNTVQSITTAMSEDGMTATLTLGAKMGAADYDITVTSKTNAEDKATYTLKAEVATLKDLVFQGENLIITDVEGKNAAVGLRGYDQFGGEVVLTSSNLQLYSSIGGTTNFDNDTQRVTLAVEQAVLLNVGNKVTITAMYNNGTNYIQKATELTVAQRAFVKEMTFGDLVSTKAALKDAKITLDNFKSNTYYLPVETAKDQYDNKLSAKELNTMITGNLLFIIPSKDMGSYYAFTDAQPFDTINGKVALKLKKGGLNKPGTFQVTATSVGGGQFSKDVTLEDNPWIDTLNVSIPEVYDGSDVELTITATDQYGNAFDLFENFPASAANRPVDNTGNSTAYLGDTNNMNDSHTTISVTKGELKYTKDVAKKTVKLVYDSDSATGGGAAAANSTAVFTITTAYPHVSTQNVVINTKGFAAGIKGLKDDVNTNLAAGSKIDFSDVAKLIFLDSYGATMAKDNTYVPVYAPSAAYGDVDAALAGKGRVATTDFTVGTAGNVPAATATKPLKYTAAFYTVAETTSTTDNFNEATGVYTAGADTSDTLTVTLYPVKYTASSNTWAWDTPVTKTISVSMTAASDLTYGLVVKDSKKLHVGKASALVTEPEVTLQLKAYDKAKTEVSIPSTTNKLGNVTADKNVSVGTPSANEVTIKYDASTEITGTGKIKVTAYVDGVDDPVSAEIAYDDAVSVATKTWFQKYNATADAWQDTDEVIDATTANKTLYINDKTKTPGAYSIGIEDQYGDSILSAAFTYVANNNPIDPSTTSLNPESSTPVKYRLSYGDLSQVVSAKDIMANGTNNTTVVNISGKWSKKVGAYTVSTTQEFLDAYNATKGNGRGDTINIASNVTLPANAVLESGDTWVAQSNVTVTPTTSLTVNGTLTVDKDVAAVANLTNGGTIVIGGDLGAITGTLTNSGTMTVKGAVGNLGTLVNSGTFTAKANVGTVGTFTNTGTTDLSGTLGVVTTWTPVTTAVDAVYTFRSANADDHLAAVDGLSDANNTAGTVTINVYEDLTTTAGNDFGGVDDLVTINNYGTFTLGNAAVINGKFYNRGVFAMATYTVTMGDDAEFGTIQGAAAITNTSGYFVGSNTNGEGFKITDLTANATETIKKDGANTVDVNAATVTAGRNTQTYKNSTSEITVAGAADKVTYSIDQA